MAIQLADLDSALLAIGKAAIFYAPAWDFASDLHADFQFLGFTEGEVRATMNETYNPLTMNEYTGEAPHEETVSGERPELTIPLFAADPNLRTILSPTGSASGGKRRNQPVVTYTLWVLPEEIFIDPADATGQADELVLAPTGSGWTMDGQALTARQTELLGLGAIFWRVRFGKPDLVYRWEEGGKVVVPVTAMTLYQKLAPNGIRLYALGDPYSHDVDILTGPIAS